ncbi:MAG TPA: GNAT family N-acetyltransferase [Clostridia bacterium]|nr:GNAT family N-acetyltransferase [Clostridia bacterium]
MARGAPVEILDLRHFSSFDLRPLLEDESSVWSRLLEWDYRGSAEMILRYIDAKILPGYAAIERGTVFGYCFFVYEGSKGVIGDLYVDRDRDPQRIRAVELELLDHVIETLQQSPGIHRVEAQLLVHNTGEASRPFVQQGFHRYERLFMTMPLVCSMHTFRAMSDEFEVRPWEDQYYQSAATLITAAYRGHVDSDINDQYRTTAGSLRFLNNIIRFPGCGVFDPAASFMAFHRSTRMPAGVILCSRVKDDVGHVTQVCMVPEHRGKGIGEALVGATHGALRARNFHQLSLTVTKANARAVSLYERLGFTTTHVFDAFVWEG